MGLTSGVPDRDESCLMLSGAARSAHALIEPAAPGQYFREICHDLRQPVAGVLSLAGAALAVPELPSAARCWLEQIVTEAESLAELIEQSVACDHPRDGCARTDLGELAHEVVASEQLTYRGLLRLTSPRRPMLAAVGRVDAWRIIANLLSNGTRAAGPDGCVTVQLARVPGHARLVVQDSGPGFARIRPSTGLGTQVITRCLARCGGQIDYGQSSTGGVKATVLLPLVRD
jgi:signal transduction histidine kinase